ncbi:unnamed protein product [Chrysodeixis includens]|uniref:Uncharacterized protein n=1 Tax=Chrysodeixis includens TaxID=689277 RepID=A0A9N8KSY4_CHRIL|nr:unnamed protein product [Chrysodeixis includens]
MYSSTGPFFSFKNEEIFYATLSETMCCREACHPSPHYDHTRFLTVWIDTARVQDTLLLSRCAWCSDRTAIVSFVSPCNRAWGFQAIPCPRTKFSDEIPKVAFPY